MNKTSLLIISGYSGSGKTTVLRTLEDIGFYTVDNLPVDLLSSFVHLASEGNSTIGHAAMVMDARGRETERVVQPLRVDARADNLYLIAHCYWRDELRTFRLDRVVEFGVEK